MTQVQQQAQSVTQTRNFVHDSLSRLKQAQNPESGLTQYQYDANGNLVQKTDAKGVATTYAYDALNRVTQRSYAGGGATTTQTVTYTYDNLQQYAKGRLTKVDNSFSATEYQEFDALGRVKQSQQKTDGVDYQPMIYTYNLSGALVEQTYPSGRKVRNTFETDGDLAKVETQKSGASWQTRAENFTYTAAGAISSLKLGNGRWESTLFNERLQPTRIALGSTQNNTNLLKLEYTYKTQGQNNNGNILSQTITVPTVGASPGFTAVQTYSYDHLNRLTDAKEMVGTSQKWRQVFTYDRFGNRNFSEASTTTLLKRCLGGGFGGTGDPIVCAADRKIYNPSISQLNNRINQDQDGDAQPDYLYDPVGNTTKDATGKTFTYDAENKQTSVINNGVPIGEYWYDGDGKRVKKKGSINGQIEETVFVYDAFGKLVAEYSNQTAQTQQISYLTTDHLGSPRINTDQDGQVITRHDYHPFGEEIFSTPQRNNGIGYRSDSIRQQFTGYERDLETDLDFAQARMYANRLGRFTTVDPLGASATTGNPQSWNRYIYTFNNPLNFIDPTGMVVDDYFINRDGSYVVAEDDCKCDRYFIETKKGSGEYRHLATLQENDLGLVEFPAAMDFFGRYGTVDAGGRDHAAGDHFLRPEVAAGLFGLAAVLKDEYGITMSFGDMSSSNGRDPWQTGFPHHDGHGHESRSGLDIDFRYINKKGESFQDVNARSSTQFSVEKNQIVYDTAETFGFTVNYQGINQGKNTGLQGVPTEDGHNDHGHIGFDAGSRRVTYADGISSSSGKTKPLFFKK